MKTCAQCKTELLLEQFATNKSKSDGKSDKCRACKKAYNVEYYSRTKQKHNPSRATRRDEMRQKAKDFVWAVKRQNPCYDCGKHFHPVALDFDHIGDKIADIARMMANGKSRDALVNEISKCELVCAVCHRLRTAYRLGIISLEDTNMRR